MPTNGVHLLRLDIIRVAGEAGADERTVRKVLKGKSTNSMASRRVETVLRRMGIRLPGDGPAPKGARR